MSLLHGAPKPSGPFVEHTPLGFVASRRTHPLPSGQPEAAEKIEQVGVHTLFKQRSLTHSESAVHAPLFCTHATFFPAMQYFFPDWNVVHSFPHGQSTVLPQLAEHTDFPLTARHVPDAH